MQGKPIASGAGADQLKPVIHDQFIGSIPAIYDETSGHYCFTSLLLISPDEFVRRCRMREE